MVNWIFSGIPFGVIKKGRFSSDKQTSVTFRRRRRCRACGSWGRAVDRLKLEMGKSISGLKPELFLGVSNRINRIWSFKGPPSHPLFLIPTCMYIVFFSGMEMHLFCLAGSPTSPPSDCRTPWIVRRVEFLTPKPFRKDLDFFSGVNCKHNKTDPFCWFV